MTATVALRAVSARASVAAMLAAAAMAVPAADASSSSPALPDRRHSGFDDMTPALQAMQRDDAQNPAMLWVQEGESLWTRKAANGRRCADCHDVDAPAVRGAAARYPVFDAAIGRPVTLPQRIDRCRSAQLGLPIQGDDGDEVLALSAFLARQARGRQLSLPDDERLETWREQGRRLWLTRMGQINLACTQCHDRRAGLRLGGATVPQAHPTGYPIYRLEWQTLGSLQRRLRGCVTGVRAEPWPADADEWIALEVFLKGRSAGMVVEGPAVRP